MPQPANRRWSSGIPAGLLPHHPTRFENKVKELRLRESGFLHSEALRAWCEKNAHRRFVPEWLLVAWEIEVKVFATAGD